MGLWAFSPLFAGQQAKGQQNINPKIMQQMVAQTPGEDAYPTNIPMDNNPVPAALRYEPPMPPDPMPVQAPGKTTATPTTSQIGTTPSELIPSQPALSGLTFSSYGPSSDQQSQNQALLQGLNAQLLAMKPAKNPELDKAMDLSNQRFQDSMLRQEGALREQEGNQRTYQDMTPGVDFRPLAALSDHWSGGNLYQAAQGMAPESDATRLQKNAEMLKGISDTKKDLTDMQLKQMGEQLKQQSYKEGRLTKEQIALMNNLTKLGVAGVTGGNQGARLGLMNKRIEVQLDKEARATLNNDPLLKTYAPRNEGAAKVLELIGAAKRGEVVSNQALLGQLNAEIGRLETGSNSPGLHAQEKTELLDKKAQVQAVIDSITGKPEDSVRPEVINAAEKLVKELSLSYMKGIDNRVDYLTAGMTPAQKKIAHAKYRTLVHGYGERFGHWNGKPVQLEVGDVMDGHEYTGGDPAKEQSWRQAE